MDKLLVLVEIKIDCGYGTGFGSQDLMCVVDRL